MLNIPEGDDAISTVSSVINLKRSVSLFGASSMVIGTIIGKCM